MNKHGDIDSADYQRFVNSKGFQPRCPLCQSETWSLVNEKDGRSYGFQNISRRGPEIQDLQNSQVLLLVCNNCAFVAPILREKIVAELDGANG